MMTIEKLSVGSKDIVGANIDKIGEIFPNVITEIKDETGRVKKTIDFDKLRQELSYDLVEGKEERYELMWPDKLKSIMLSNAVTQNTLRPDYYDSVNFSTTENLYIEGDNLETLKILQESYLGKVKLIYIDPPYNTGKNIIYKNNYHQDAKEYYKNSAQIDDENNRLTKNLESNGRFHTDWLNMIYPRIRLAKHLLRKDGVFACSIDENELGTLSTVLKDVFTESSYEHNYISVVHNPRGQQGLNFSYVNEYLILIYPKDGKKYLSDFPKKEVDARNLRDSGTDSDRTNARNCFYPFYVKENKIIGIGEVPEDTFHPVMANLERNDGSIEIWPINESGDEKKWRYARQTVDEIFSQLEVKKGRTDFQIIFNKSDETLRSVWSDSRYDASEYGTKLVRDLFNKTTFTYPKSLWTMYDILLATVKNDKDAIVMDFFSGSGTTAHALMQLNLDLGGNRKYIMVQIPENLNQSIKRAGSSKEKKEIQNTIDFLNELEKPLLLSEIGKERIRRAGEKILVDNKDKEGIDKLDTGFRVLRVDSTNMNDVAIEPNFLEQDNLEDLESNIKADRTDLDLLFACLLAWGLPLDRQYESEDYDGFTIHSYNDGDLIACFSESISEEAIKYMAKKEPLRIVFRDSCFKTSQDKINVEEIFKIFSPETDIRVL